MPHPTTPHPEGMPRPGRQRVCISGFVCGHFCGWVTWRAVYARRGGVEVGGECYLLCCGELRLVSRSCEHQW
jgi:hypothetical protein